MSGRILIIDSVATHRIVLKAKLASAQYDVETCATCEEAETMMQDRRPDLVLVNLSDQTEDRYEFCRELRGSPDGDGVAIVGVSVADTSRARFAALDAGADDVLPHQVSDAFMQARIRSLLRRRNVGLEWQMREETSKVLGFEDGRGPFMPRAHIAVLSDNATSGAQIAEMLQNSPEFGVRVTTTAGAIGVEDNPSQNDLFIIDGTLQSRPKGLLFQLIVVLPKGQQSTAAMLLDLGADDVVFDDVSPQELDLRAHALVSHKEQLDHLRDRVKTGLRAAVTDSLTGLYNRRYAENHLKRVAEQAEASGRSYAVMVVDIDHFKAINDTYGHKAGDLVLIEIAKRFNTNFRAIDLLARIGGEEFLVAMPNTAIDQAQIAAERLRALVTETPFDIGEAHPKIRVTVSVGVAVERDEEIGMSTLDTLVVRADEALYKSKAMGRNMVSVSVNAA